MNELISRPCGILNGFCRAFFRDISQIPCSDVMGSDEKASPSVAMLRKQVRERIGYGDLLISHSGDREIIDGIVELILEVELSGRPEMVIAGDSFPTELVRERFQRLRRDHVEYVLECMNATSFSAVTVQNTAPKVSRTN